MPTDPQTDAQFVAEMAEQQWFEYKSDDVRRLVDIALVLLAAQPTWQPIAEATDAQKNGQPVWVVAQKVSSDTPRTMFGYWSHRQQWWYQFGAGEPTRIYPTLFAPLPAAPAPERELR